MNETSPSFDEAAKQLGQGVAARADDVAASARQAAGDVAEGARTYAKDAVNKAGKRIDDARGQLAAVTDSLQKSIHNDPVRAVAVAALVSAALTALVVTALRRGNRTF